MSKKDNVKELVNLLTKSLRHKIGSIVNPNEMYAEKYAKDSELLMRAALKVSIRENWNKQDKIEIEEMLRKKLEDELKKKEFLDMKKFEIMESEIQIALRYLNLD